MAIQDLSARTVRKLLQMFNAAAVKGRVTLRDKVQMIQEEMPVKGVRILAVALQSAFELFQQRGWRDEAPKGYPYEDRLEAIQEELTGAFGAIGIDRADKYLRAEFEALPKTTDWAKEWLDLFHFSPLGEYLPGLTHWRGLADYFPKKVGKVSERVVRGKRRGRAKVARSERYRLCVLKYPAKGATDRRAYLEYWALTEAGYHDSTVKLKRKVDRCPARYRTKRAVEDWFNPLKKAIDGALEDGWSPFLPDHLLPEAYRQTKTGSTLLVDKIDQIVRFKVNQYPDQESNYRSQVGTFKSWLLESGRDIMVVGDKSGSGHLIFTREDVRAYMDYLLNVRGLSHNSVVAYLSLAKAVFQQMVDDGDYAKNPFSKVTMKKQEVEGHVPYTEEEGTKILNYLDRERPGMALACRMIYFGYFRPMEVLQLQRKEIDFTEREIHLPAGKSKPKIARTVIIDPPLLRALKAAGIDKLAPDDYLFHRWGLPGKGVFYMPSSWKPTDAQLRTLYPDGYKGLSWEAIRKGIKAKGPATIHEIGRHYTRIIREKLGISKDKTIYTWKHTGAIAALQNGRNVVWIQRQAGHTTLMHTQRYLSKLPRKGRTTIYNRFSRTEAA